VRGELRQAIPASTTQTFRAFEDAEAWPVWLDAIKSVTWTSPQPFGVGTTRDIQTPGGTVSETFFAWEPGERMSFYFSAGGPPGLKAFVEDWQLEPVGAESCTLIWSWGFELGGPAKVAQPLVNALFTRMGKKSMRNLAEYMRTEKSKYF